MAIRKGNTSIIEKRYIRSTLQRAAARMEESQQKLLNNSKNIPRNLLSKRTITIQGSETLSMSHLLAQRFIDMKRLSNQTNPVYTPIHNRIIIGEYNRIYNELQFGFTEDIKAKIAGNLKIEL